VTEPSDSHPPSKRAAPPSKRAANDGDDALLGASAAKVYRDRRRRETIAGTAGLFGEPAWDILLKLFVAACERRKVSVAAACAAADVPEAVALRWVAILENGGLILREGGAQRRFVRLSPLTFANLADYFREA
jgi:hypothetical protein